MLDVGAGTGRDAAWLAGLGHEVVAVEPSSGMRAVAVERHSHAQVRWIGDRLPELTVVGRSGLSFDLILLSAVWMHVPPGDRPRAFRKLINLLRPGGCIAITLREGPSEPGRAMQDVSVGEIETLARQHGGFVEHQSAAPDQQGRPDVRWTRVLVRPIQNGTGALRMGIGRCRERANVGCMNMTKGYT